nr:hypothetical protein B0A51_01802 [Rachicladosporium sp. CCFEE 5018]
MASKAVNVPVNAANKEKDINAKLQLYGIYSAFANGKVPSNKQIDVAMNTAMHWQGLSQPNKKLSADGQTLVHDLRNVIEQAKLLMLSKNQGNLLQDFIWQTQQIGKADAHGIAAPIDKDTAKQHGNEALEGLRTLGTLLITNGQFRKLLSDASVLLRDIAGDAAQKTANKVNPSEDALSQLDKPAEDNVWHEAPDLSRENIRGQIQSKVPIGRKDLDKAAGDAAQATNPDGSRDPTAAADRAAQDQQQGTSSTNPQAGAKVAAQNLKDTASQNIPEDQKEKARQYRERTNAYFKDKLPQERREQVVYRLKKMVVEIQGHQDYSQAIDTLLRLAEEYSGHTQNLAQQGTSSAKGARNQDEVHLAEANLKTLLERFANSTSFDDITDSINQIYRDADKDPELKDWFRSMNRYIRRCLKEQGYILQDSSNEDWNKLYDHGHYLLRDRYKNHTDRIVDEFKYVGDQFDKDPQNRAFGDAMQKLFLDLGNDENGKSTFKPHLVKDLTEVILPMIFENIRYVPIPRIEYSDHMIDAIVENLVIEGDNLTPNVLEFGSDNYWRWGRKSIASKNKNKVMLSVSGVQCDLRDVSYYVKKKEGFPGITDKGVMDVFLGGSGLSFKVAMETADKSDRAHFFKINNVEVDVKNLQLKLKQSNHKLLFNLFKPLLLKVMKPVLQKVIEKQIKDNVQQLDAIMYKAKIEADRAQQEAMENPDPEHIQNMYQRYFNALQKQFLDKKQKAEEVAGDKKVNMAVTQHDSIFKNIALPGGISTKATEYKELAAKGDKWESPVFSIGSASESSNLPKVSELSRRTGGTSTGTRGPSNLDGTNGGIGSGLAGGAGGAGLAGAGLAGGSGLTGGHGSGLTGGQGSGLTGGQGSGLTGGQGSGLTGGQGSGLTGGQPSSLPSHNGPTGTSNSGFANQVDGAFSSGNSNLASGLSSNTGALPSGTTGTSGLTGSGTTGTGASGTFLGQNNPVLRGDA